MNEAAPGSVPGSRTDPGSRTAPGSRGASLVSRLAPPLGIALGLALAVFSSRRLLATLSEPVPEVLQALHAHPDATAPLSPAARKAIFILIDGLGRAPFERLVDEGLLGPVAWRARLDSGVPSLSRPAYHASLTGVPQEASGIRHNAYTRARADSLPARVRDAGGKVAFHMDGIAWFHELFGEPGDRVVRGPSARSDGAFRETLATDPTLVIIHWVDVDGAGHEEGAASDRYAREARAAMSRVAHLRALAAEAPGGDDRLWMIGADHGHTARGGHGGSDRAVRDISWVGVGSGVVSRHVDGNLPIGTVAPTLAAAMGLGSPRHSIVDGQGLTAARERVDAPARAERIRDVTAALAAHRSVTDVRKGAALVAWLLAIGMLGRWLGARRVALALAPSLAGIAAYLAFGLGITLSAIATEERFVLRAVLLVAAGALVPGVLAVGRARWTDAPLVAGLFPLGALAWTLGSLGSSSPVAAEVLLCPAASVVPVAVLIGTAVAQGLAWARSSRVRAATFDG